MKYYYIQNRLADYIGNAIVFWAKNSMGYTPNLNDADTTPNF